jgi:hypothetical protein
MLQAEDPLPEGAPEGVGREGELSSVFDETVAEIAARLEPAYSRAEGWLEQMRAGLMEMLRFCDERPDAARTLVVESIAWGTEVLERRGQLLDVLAEALDRGRAQVAPAVGSDLASVASSAPSSADPAAKDAAPPLPPPGTAENLVGACVSLVHTRLLQAGTGPLLELGPSLMSMIAHPYLGPKAAKRELERPFARLGQEPAACRDERAVVGVRERSY